MHTTVTKKIFFFLSFVLLSTSFVTAQDTYKETWVALNNNDRVKAVSLIARDKGNPASSADNFITSVYLNLYEGRENVIKDFSTSFYDKVDNPYPYLYALWFNGCVLGDYGKKKWAHQLQLLDRILSDQKAPGNILASAHYQKGMHFLFSNKSENAAKEFAQIGNIKNWQYVGPFENLSQSGIYKEYGPLQHPEPAAEFKSSSNAPIKWFTPAAENKDGWNPVCYQVNRKTAVTYAQTFVTAEQDMDIYLNAGVSGAVKVWLNDEQVIGVYKERVTDLDTYTVPCKLKKGVNRILIQLGYTGNSYANFIIRLTDKNHQLIPGLAGSPEYKPYNKVTGAPRTYTLVPHFAEAYFQEKIAAQPDNLVNYLLLSDVYSRSKKMKEARHTIESALAKAPGNNLLRMKLIEVLIDEENRPVLLEHIEKLKTTDPQSLLTLELNIAEYLENEKYDNALKEIKKREELFGEDETSIKHKMDLLGKQNNYDELLKLVEHAHKKFPENEGILTIMYEVKKQVYKDHKGAIKLYENYLKENYSASILRKYTEILEEQGETKKCVQLKMKFPNEFPFDPSGFSDMASHYFSEKEYAKAEGFIKQALALSPYDEYYWEKLGDIKSETQQTDEAIKAYDRSLLYDPNQYAVINKIRKLKGKEESYKLLPEPDVDAIIANDKVENAKNTDYGYYIIYNGKNTIMHPGGATEEHFLWMLRITNERGIEKYKETSIGYSSGQSLLIEKAEIVKKSGARIQGERNDNQLVFTNLEVGDVIVFKYRLQNYIYGRFAKEFVDRSYFNGQIYTGINRYDLLLPADQPVKYLLTNSDLQPTISNVENFKRYSWETKNMEPMKEEPFSPNNCDIGNVLHISTIPSWQHIASWYADIVNSKTEEEYEITELFKTLFPKTPPANAEFKTAKTIYEYIQKNIRYSSVPFRQSAFVPQTASVTLNTRLGDCKDISNLFVTLCRMANIDCKMVLVNTRDNGAKELMLPSTSFNHCIVKAKLNGKDYFIELTDNNLPFASLPNNLIDAVVLEIPAKDSDARAEITPLVSPHRTRDVIRRTTTIRVNESDLVMDVSCTKYGNLSARVRYSYANLDQDKQLKEMEKAVASSYKNTIKMDKLVFSDLSTLEDSVKFTYSCKVKDEVAEIGSLHTFRITYPDVVATLNNFTADQRSYPIEYLNFEDADVYESIVKIEAPAGKKFVELPTNENLKFGNMVFSITYQLTAPDKLLVTRKFISERKIIPAKDYAAFKEFFGKIIKAEQKMIAFK